MTPNPESQIPNRKCRRHTAAAGFTLIEAALTMVIVGTGILAMVSAQQAYHIKNDWAQRTGTAQLLANELREMTLALPHHDPITGSATLGPESNEPGVADWDDLDDFAGTVSGGYATGVTFNPPINGLRQEVPDLNRWAQVVTIENVLPENIKAATAQPLGSTDMIRMTVTVTYHEPGDSTAQPVTELTWVVAR